MKKKKLLEVLVMNLLIIIFLFSYCTFQGSRNELKAKRNDMQNNTLLIQGEH